MRNESYIFAFYLQANTEPKGLCKAYLQVVLPPFTGRGYTGFFPGFSYTQERKMEGLRISNFSCYSLTTSISAPLEKEGRRLEISIKSVPLPLHITLQSNISEDPPYFQTCLVLCILTSRPRHAVSAMCTRWQYDIYADTPKFSKSPVYRGSPCTGVWVETLGW